MKAIAFSKFGGPEVLGVHCVPPPESGPGLVRIKVRAAAVNHADIAMRRDGASGMLKSTPPWIPGMEAAGVVDEPGDSDFAVGDEVMAIAVPFGRRQGAQAEFLVVPTESVVAIPAGVDFSRASAIPMNAMTAHLALSELALGSGATLAVTGGAGVLGGYIAAMATDRGITVIADSQDSDVPLVEASGAIVVPRGPGIADRIRAEVPSGVDGAVDTAGIGAALIPAVADGGRLIAAAPQRNNVIGERGIAVTPILVAAYSRNREAMREIGALAARQVLRPRIIGTYPPEDIVEVHRKFERGGLRGRLIISFDEVAAASGLAESR